MKIKLVTVDGGLVGKKEIPPFLIPPDIINWGERFFTYDDYNSETDIYEYKEGFTYAIIGPLD